MQLRPRIHCNNFCAANDFERINNYRDTTWQEEIMANDGKSILDYKDLVQSFYLNKKLNYAWLLARYLFIKRPLPVIILLILKYVLKNY